MSMPKKIALTIAILGGLLLLLTSSRSKASHEDSPNTDIDKDRPSAALKSRAHKDVNRLARALSLVAAQTIGLVEVRGRVLDRQTGNPIGGAEVVFTGPSGESGAQCDADGRYSLEVIPGFYRSYAQATDFVAVAPKAAERLPKQDLASAVAMPRASIAPLAGLFRNRPNVDLYLVGGATLEAQVVDLDGHPIAGALVAAESTERVQLLSGTDVGESDDNGKVRLRVPAGPIFFRAQHEDFAGTKPTSRVYVRSGQAREITIVLMRGCIIEGEVVHQDGSPALEGAIEKMLPNGSYVPVGAIQAGRLRYTQTHEGPVIVRAWPWKSPPSADHKYECTNGLHVRDETFVVPEATASLTGHLEDQDGKRIPLAFVDVFALEAGGTGQQERADAGGEFEFYSLKDGPYQLSAYIPGRGAVVQLIDVPSSGVPLRLGGVGAISGTVDWLERGSLTMRYACEFELPLSSAAQHDAVSMPMQSTLVLVENHHFRVEDVPACPIEGTLTTKDRFEAFQVVVESNKDALLYFD